MEEPGWHRLVFHHLARRVGIEVGEASSRLRISLSFRLRAAHEVNAGRNWASDALLRTTSPPKRRRQVSETDPCHLPVCPPARAAHEASRPIAVVHVACGASLSVKDPAQGLIRA